MRDLIKILRRYKFSNLCLECEKPYIDSLIERFETDEAVQRIFVHQVQADIVKCRNDFLEEQALLRQLAFERRVKRDCKKFGWDYDRIINDFDYVIGGDKNE